MNSNWKKKLDLETHRKHIWTYLKYCEAVPILFIKIDLQSQEWFKRFKGKNRDFKRPIYFHSLPKKIDIKGLNAHWLYRSYYARKMRAQYWNHFWYQMSNRHTWQLKKSKSWGPFWSYQLNSTANSDHLAHFHGKLAELAVLFSW